jgi:hypothetical protein
MATILPLPPWEALLLSMESSPHERATLSIKRYSFQKAANPVHGLTDPSEDNHSMIAVLLLRKNTVNAIRNPQ